MLDLNFDNKKLIKMLGTLMGILIVILIFIFIIIGMASSKVSDKKLPIVIEQAAIKYYVDHKDDLPSVDGEKVTLDASTLISSKYMKSFEKMTKNTGCSAKVVTTNNGGEYNHIVSIDCNEFKTQTLSDVVKNTVTKTGDGLYLVNDEYYYRGEYVDNYVRIDNVLYRIVSIDKDGNMKLTSTMLSDSSYSWDDRYNVEKNQDGLGINNYELSRIKENIDKIYEGYSSNLKKHIKNSEWCVGTRGSEDGNMNLDECSKTVKDYVGLITLKEYVRPSLDSNCKGVLDGACVNYNYLSHMYEKNFWTAIAVSDNTYEAFRIGSTYIENKRTYMSCKVLVMFNIDGNELYVSGTGTDVDPYVIR